MKDLEGLMKRHLREQLERLFMGEGRNVPATGTPQPGDFTEKELLDLVAILPRRPVVCGIVVSTIAMMQLKRSGLVPDKQWLVSDLSYSGLPVYEKPAQLAWGWQFLDRGLLHAYLDGRITELELVVHEEQRQCRRMAGPN